LENFNKDNKLFNIIWKIKSNIGNDQEKNVKQKVESKKKGLKWKHEKIKMRFFWIKYSIITILLGLSIAALTLFLTGDDSPPYQSLADIDEFLVGLSSQSWKLHFEYFDPNFQPKFLHIFSLD